MAAVVRGGHARHGGRGRAQGGRGRRGAAAAAADAPQWNLWKQGNTNNPRKPTREEEMELRIYRELENNPRVNQDELNTYGVSAGLLNQADDIVRKLHSLVTVYNRMGGTRCRYLFKKLHGAWGKEMTQMAKNITSDCDLARSMVDDIITAHGYCPPVPTLFNELPKLL